MRSLIYATAILLAASPAFALKEPDPGKQDPRMVTAPYDPGQVYAVHVPQGQAFAVTFSKDERVTDAFGADKQKLVGDMTGNVFLLNSGDDPVKARSIFVRTVLQSGEGRTYTLLVDTRPPEHAPISLTFTYPGQVTAAQAAAWKAAQQRREQKVAEAALAEARGEADTNPAYILQGETAADWSLLPTRRVSDNSTDTHFWFPGNMRVPVIYAVNPDGKEALVDYIFDSTTGVATVHQLARVFHLRDGDSLLAVYNKRFDPVGIRSTTGTVSASVRRAVRE